MAENRSRFVAEPDWLAANLGSGIKIVDASWYLPAQGRDPRAEYEAGHIPGAVFFDQDIVVDPASSLPHTLPSPEIFAEHAGLLGLSASDTIVVYDGPGMFTAPRVWWMLRTMGAPNVKVLDGGFDNWKRQGRPVTAEPTEPERATFTSGFDAAAVVTIEDMRGIVEDGGTQIADARSAGRFSGEEPEPRAGMRSGHMPGARNVPVSSLSESGRLKSLPELRAIFEKAGVDLGRPVVTTCGSGVTAAAITLALVSLSHGQNMLYDGSWSEWGGRSDTPVEIGPAKLGETE